MATEEQAQNIAAAVANAAYDTSDTIREAIDTGREKAARGYRRVSRFAHNVADRSAMGYRYTKDFVVDNRSAIISTAVAFGIGFLIARFLFRK